MNDVALGEGGETGFYHANELKVRARRNSAVLWYNVLPNGVEDTRTLHSGQPMLGPVKWGMNMWLRDPRLVGPLVKCSALEKIQ